MLILETLNTLARGAHLPHLHCIERCAVQCGGQCRECRYRSHRPDTCTVCQCGVLFREGDMQNESHERKS